MSVRLARLASPKPPPRLMSFAQYKARGTLEATRYQANSEKPPQHAWYVLDHQRITSGIHQLCSSLLDLTINHAEDDAELANLHTALDEAKLVSHKKSFCIAMLGDQGNGKSSCLCSILDRALVDISSSSSACTAFPTLITYKPGASDDTGESEVQIQYFNNEEIKQCSEEQARRYRFAHPRKTRSGVGSSLVYDEYRDYDEEEQEEESEDEREQILNSAKTAKDFFEIIFRTDESRARENQLHDLLLYGDIESSKFARMCVRYVNERLDDIGVKDGFTLHNAVLDEDLDDVRAAAKEVWPLVKSVRLSTGHCMLRNNLSFLDLPGYGDTNHIRTAIIEKFRDMADFEIVVAPAQRLLTSVAQNTYLNRSIHRLGAQNTLLVANKSDQLLDDLIPRGVNKLKDGPFPEAKQRLKESETLLRNRGEPRHIIQDYRRYVLESPASEFLRLEEKRMDEKIFEQRQVHVRLVSARQYSLCLDAYGDEAPRLTAEATGIPRLRQYLLKLPARKNYETVQYHMHETLPDIVYQAERILNKFSEDAVYAKMREDLETWLPKTQGNLESTIERLISVTVAKPWGSDKAQQAILSGIEELVLSLRHPNPYYATTLKIIKETGIPVNGKAKGRNLNDEILSTMTSYIQYWNVDMERRIAHLATSLDAHLQTVLRQLRAHLANQAEHVELKEQASNALEIIARRIAMAHEKLIADLESSLRATFVQYTTETHVHCPVALAMRPVYHSVLDVVGGPGAYTRHRQQLYECLCDPPAPGKNFAEVMATNIANTLEERWTQCGREYTSEGMAQLTRFSQIADELLDSGGYVKADRREIRDQLRILLPTFKASLSQLQKACPRLQAADTKSPSARLEKMDLFGTELSNNTPPAKRRRIVK